MKLVAFSDIHGQQSKLQLPPGDIAICAGDCTNMGRDWEVREFCEWYGKQPHVHKILIAGNHDWDFQNNPKKSEQICAENGIIYLNDSGITIDEVNFYGSPVQPHFCAWAFNRARNEADSVVYDPFSGKTTVYPLIKPHWDMIPANTDVLITHSPPYGVLDELVRACGTPSGRHVGCSELMKRILEVKPDIHIFGHIHCGYGELHQDGTSYYNVAICDEMYCPTNSPKVIEVIK